MESGYEKIRDRRKVLEESLNRMITERQQRRERENRKNSGHIHTTEESMNRYGSLNDKTSR